MTEVVDRNESVGALATNTDAELEVVILVFRVVHNDAVFNRRIEQTARFNLIAIECNRDTHALGTVLDSFLHGLQRDAAAIFVANGRTEFS